MSPLTPNTQKPSADKGAYVRGAVTNTQGGRVVFEDELKRKSRKRKAKTLKNGGMYFTELDRQMVEFVASFGFIRVQDLAALMGMSRDAVRLRGRRHIKFGLLKKSYNIDRGLIYTVTPKGLGACGLHGYRAVTPKATTMYHTIAEVAALRWVAQQWPNRPVVTERDVAAAIRSGDLTPRVTRGFEWTKDYTDFEKWRPSLKGGSGVKYPDLLILWNSKNGPNPPIPCEVELTPKGTKDYTAWLETYSEAAKDNVFSPGVLVFVDSESKKKATVEQTLKRLTAKKVDPISGKTPWANLDVRVEGLGDLFESYETARGKVIF